MDTAVAMAVISDAATTAARFLMVNHFLLDVRCLKAFACLT